MGKRILIGPSTFAALDNTPIKLLENAGFTPIQNPYRRKLTKKELIELLKDDVEGIIAGLETIDEDVISQSNIKVVSRCGAGIDNVDQEVLRKKNIKFYFTPYGPTQAVAELTVGIMINLLRNINYMDNKLHQGKWEKQIGEQLFEKKVAIIGFGRIGKRICELLRPFKNKLLIVEPELKIESDLYQICQLDDAISRADIITLHNSGNQLILGEKEFRLMKKNVIILNASRGASIDEGELIKNLENKKVKNAWIDTFGIEPYQGKLTEFPQVILTPHIGSYTKECRYKMEIESANNLIDGFKEINNECI
jgi:D-3-phosphoglycerate dehydrogenase / 2-oxoglutarate reductase